ncbi:MAG TPA: hypothetical protein VHJ16_02885 [Xanthobacteraceae bacterium]|jgi:hypothetical protein|nr:hypothetical protein [Xanthobacteraceae bacterium]
MIARTGACLAGLVISCWAPAASAADCTVEAVVLAKEQSELPRLDVASPADRPLYCITLETLMAFAGRVKAHVAHCPRSDYAAALANWDKTRIDYAKLFSRYRCKRAR